MSCPRQQRRPRACRTRRPAFSFPAGSTVWYHDLEGHYEDTYDRKEIEDVAEGDWAAPPLTAQLPDGAGYASVTEAGLSNYAGMALQADRRGVFQARLGHAVPASYPYRLRYPALEVLRLATPAKISGAITTPWRAVIIGADLNALVNSDLVSNLSPAPDAATFPQGLDTPWIKPGRAVWRYLDGGDNTFEGIKEFSGLAGKLGFEYHVVEGLWRRWTDDQLRDLVEYSNQRNVKLILWVHSRDLWNADARRALFKRLHDLTIAGVKIDFLDHEAKDVIDLYHAILRDAAQFQLVVNFHGANKPAGESRTWPNELTREGVYGLEHRAQSWAAHNTTAPFTRYLAGHGDFTPVVFGDRRKETIMGAPDRDGGRVHVAAARVRRAPEEPAGQPGGRARQSGAQRVGPDDRPPDEQHRGAGRVRAAERRHVVRRGPERAAGANDPRGPAVPRPGPVPRDAGA